MRGDSVTHISYTIITVVSQVDVVVICRKSDKVIQVTGEKKGDRRGQVVVSWYLFSVIFNTRLHSWVIKKVVQRLSETSWVFVRWTKLIFHYQLEMIGCCSCCCFVLLIAKWLNYKFASDGREEKRPKRERRKKKEISKWLPSVRSGRVAYNRSGLKCISRREWCCGKKDGEKLQILCWWWSKV